jgi:hypothetical protein
MHPLAGVMDVHGMLPDDWFCTGCGKQLNADGNHPAELYAGTWNGLCYSCTQRGPFVREVSALDGALRVSWPPSCPSYRRDRQDYHAYEGCGACHGLGSDRYESSMGGFSSYPVQCEACMHRYMNHPERVRYNARWTALREAAQRVFDREWDRAAGVPTKCSKKRRIALREALPKDARDALRPPILARYQVLEARLKAHADALGVSTWRTPAAEEARFEAAVQRRARDMGITE